MIYVVDMGIVPSEVCRAREFMMREADRVAAAINGEVARSTSLARFMEMPQQRVVIEVREQGDETAFRPLLAEARIRDHLIVMMVANSLALSFVVRSIANGHLYGVAPLLYLLNLSERMIPA